MSRQEATCRGIQSEQTTQWRLSLRVLTRCQPKVDSALVLLSFQFSYLRFGNFFHASSVEKRSMCGQDLCQSRWSNHVNDSRPNKRGLAPRLRLWEGGSRTPLQISFQGYLETITQHHKCLKVHQRHPDIARSSRIRKQSHMSISIPLEVKAKSQRVRRYGAKSSCICAACIHSRGMCSSSTKDCNQTRWMTSLQK